jgi:putative Ca2+/H+ antiporter (TMEM165/GDT1 family)
MKNAVNWQVFFVAFTTLFIAEMGDKTQLAVFTLTADSKAPWAVFSGASLALIAVTLIGVLFGGAVTRVIPPNYLKLGAGFLFVGIGFYTLWETYLKMVTR